MTGMPAFRATLYNVLMKRNSVYVTACVLGSYVATNAYLSGTDSIWKSINKGKSWEEVQATLPPKEDEDDD
ncbi:unnamed protein product [Chondrus crispus]|uniref:Complex III subunit 9 n=1 Tax=Chondrus crispus TaxID=2769 RepID=S0F3V2_CHOCR|nr:unnamed protein product [Chondrus crispus]CDF77478.1 unnamed protein product [Chondrus crispus]|eukprot:XP_005712352.1 unnamed protein product [Chondrus crispus]